MTLDDNTALLDDAEVDANAAINYLIRVLRDLNNRVLHLEGLEMKRFDEGEK